MTNQVSHHGNPTDDQQLHSKIKSLEIAVENLEHENWVLAQKAKLTLADISNMYLRKALKLVTIINIISAALTLLVVSVGFDLLVTSIKGLIHFTAMSNRSIIQIAIDKLMPHSFNFIDTFIHNFHPSFIAVSASLGTAIAVAIFFSALALSLDDVA